MKKNYIFEEWKDIKGYEGIYQVSNFGRIKSLERLDSSGAIRKETLLKQYKNHNGYLVVTLCKNGVSKKFFVHRLVAEAFIPNPLNLPYVNHKGENKSKNYVWQLEWCTKEYNNNYGSRNLNASKTKIENHIKGKVVFQYDLNNNFLKEWLSISDIERELGYKRSVISKCCLNKPHCKTAYGYIWKYKKAV